MRVKLSSKLFDVDIDTESLEEMIDTYGGMQLPVDKNWTAKIGLFPHPDMKPETIYVLKYGSKLAAIKLIEKWQGEQYEHFLEEIDKDAGFIEAGYIIEFILGLDSSLRYAT